MVEDLPILGRLGLRLANKGISHLCSSSIKGWEVRWPHIWLVRSTLEQAVRVRALARDIVLCSWARHFTLTVPLSTRVYKWVPANLMLGGNPAMG